MKSLEDLLLKAHVELCANPTITTYTFEDGVEKREPADLHQSLCYAMDFYSDGFETLAKAVAEK